MNTSHTIPKSKGCTPLPRNFSPLHSFTFASFLKLDKTDIIGGDLSSMPMNSTEDAKAYCTQQGSECKGFVYRPGTHLFYLKYDISGGRTYNSDTTTIIKAAFATLLTTPKPPPTSQCIVSEATGSLSNECRLPELNPFDEAILKSSHPITSLNCPGKRITEYRNGELRVLSAAEGGFASLLYNT